MAGPGKDEGGVTRVTQAVSLTKMEGEVAKGFGRGRYFRLRLTVAMVYVDFKEQKLKDLHPKAFHVGCWQI